MRLKLFIALLAIITAGLSFLSFTPSAALGDSSPIISAHRGGRNIPGYPENALETFAYTRSRVPSAWIECDVNMSRDSMLFLLHDASLDRTTTGTGLVKGLDWSIIDTCHLVDDFKTPTSWKVPMLVQTLDWARQQGAGLFLDIKRGVPFAEVVAQVEAAKMVDQCIIIVYNAGDAARVSALNPDIRISTAIRNQEELERHLELGIPLRQLYAFVGTRLPASEHLARLDSLHIPTILGSLGNLDQRAAARGDTLYCNWGQQFDVLATDRPFAAYAALEKCR
jgi:glycerophosphoryl diester phosphodiesterase